MSEILVVKLGGTTIADQAQVLDEVASVARRIPRSSTWLASWVQRST